MSPDEGRRQLRGASAVFVCAGDDAEGLDLAFAIERLVGPSTAIVTRLLIESRGFSELLGERTRAVQVFGVLDRVLSLEMITDTRNETIAQALHEQYVAGARRGDRPHTGAPLVDWAALPEDFKAANRAQARAVMEKLARANCGVRPLSDWTAELVVFDDDEVDRLARLEHDRWTEERLRAGWTYGPVRDDRRRHNPNLVDWERLDEPTKEVDRNFVRALPGTLAAAGLHAFRLPPPAPEGGGAPAAGTEGGALQDSLNRK